MSRYKTAPGTGWIDTQSGSHIPNDPRNSDAQAVLAWIAEGNTPDPPDPLPEPEPSIAAEIGGMLTNIEFGGVSASEEMAIVLMALTGYLESRGF